MKISQKTIYAIRALLHLAEAGRGGRRFSVGEIAGACEIPVPFLHLIFRTLKSGGLVESQRGKGGGYTLARSPESITVAEIFECVEGVDALSLVSHDTQPPPAVIAELCRDAEVALRAVFSSCSLSDLEARACLLREAASIGYHI